MLARDRVMIGCPGEKESEHGGLLREYIIKREFSEGAVVMTSFSFPDVTLQGCSSS